MLRRTLVVTAIAASSVMLVRAFDNVTFILTNGQRASGDIASTSEASPAMPHGELNLEKAGADERSYGWEMVAVIEYDGNKPSNEELAALTSGGHMLVLRDGSRHAGRMASLRGDTLRWSGMSGRVEQYSVGQIAKIYLNADAARSAYNYDPSAKPAIPPTQPDPTTPTTPRGRRSTDGSVLVSAAQPWTDTGRSYKAGEVLQIVTTGEIRFGRGDSQRATSAGNDDVRNNRFPVPALPVGALIGRIGNGQAFAIGSNTTLTIPTTGRLFLGINDDGYEDNAGQFRVVITRR
jgi:hypothetical protein